MRNILFILAALIGFGAFAQTNIPTRQMLADTNGVVKWPTNITRIRIGGTDYTNLQTQLGGGGSGLITSVSDDFDVTAGDLALTNALGTGPLVRQSAATGVGTVTSVGASTTVSGLGFSGSPVTESGTLSLTGTVAVASGGTGATDASGARTALSLVPGTNVQAWDADLDDLADGSLTGSKVGTGVDDDFVAFDDADNLWTATFIGPALEELNDSINAGVPNGTGAKLHWSQLLGVPAGFADGTDDGAGGGSGTMTGITITNSASLPFSFSPNSTTTSNTFTLSPSNQTANLFYSGPTSGGAAAPTFRALVDDDVPDTITASNYQPLDSDLTTLATLNGSALTNLNGSNIASGTVADARIDSALTRDAEAALAYQPLDPDLTAMAAGTAVPTAQTNAVSMGAPVLYAGGTNVAEHLALKAPLASPAFTASATIGGTNVLDYAATHLTEAEASALYQRTNTTVRLDGTTPLTGAWNTGSSAISANTIDVTDDAYDATGWNGSTNVPTKNALRDKIETMSAGTWDGTPIASGTITNLTANTVNEHPYIDEFNGDFFVDGVSSATPAYQFFPQYSGGAISSGSTGNTTATTNSPGLLPVTASASANSGYYWRTGPAAFDLGHGGDTHINYVTIPITNSLVARLGFFDTSSSSAPVDSVHVLLQSGYAIGVVSSASSFTYTTTSNRLALSSTALVRFTSRILDDASGAAFEQATFTSGSWVTNWSDTITATIPTGSDLTGAGVLAIHTAGSAGTTILNVDAMAKINRKVIR